MVKVEVNRKLCMGCGACASLLPEVFELDEDGVSRVKNPNGASIEKIKEVAEMCPAHAIKVSEK